MQIERSQNESEYDYHKRLIYGKLVDKTLADVDYTELAQFVYGQPYSSDVARRMIYGSKRTLDILEKERMSADKMDPVTSAEIDDKMNDLRKERQKFFDMRNAFNKTIREKARREEVEEAIARYISKSSASGELPTLSYEPHTVEHSDNDLLCSLNDIHYGIDIHNAWNTYNPSICRQMMALYLDRIIDIAERNNSENCFVFNNGDSISGKIHTTIQLANIENVVGQVKGVSELIAEFLAVLSKHFRKVVFVSVSGNHSRLDTKENSPLGERLDDLIEWYLSARLQNFDNVVIGGEDFFKIDSTMYTLDIRGKTYVGVHGDFDVGDSKISAMRAMVGKDIYAVLSGHMHHNRVDEAHGIKTIMAGSFIGMDDFCIQKRIFGKPEQIVCVCSKNGVECFYDIPLSVQSDGAFFD